MKYRAHIFRDLGVMVDLMLDSALLSYHLNTKMKGSLIKSFKMNAWKH